MVFVMYQKYFEKLKVGGIKMQMYKMDGLVFKTLVINGAENLKLNYQKIDALNVFPVPDGDTGTNMRMTIESGVNEIRELKEKNIYEISKRLSRGMLMGARGNSGVILSQLFRGLFNGFQGYEEVDAIKLAKAFESSVEQAYKAVMKPVEGTILTVAREASEKMLKAANTKMSIPEFFEMYLHEVQASLERTPELLPVLKESGVVDSGGAGYLCIVEGMYKALKGELISIEPYKSNLHTASILTVAGGDDPEFGYCTEFILQLSRDKVEDIEAFEEETILNKIVDLGDSIVVVKDDDLVKVHLHTLTPGVVLTRAQEFGEFLTLKIENMTVQHSQNNLVAPVNGQAVNGQATNGFAADATEVYQKSDVRKKYAIVTVASGKGLVNTFKEMGADYVVEGGQTMNPSTEDFVRAYKTLNADHILVFPNNKNIILTARQSINLAKDSQVHVIETTTIAQGFSALTMLDLNGEPEEIIADIEQVIDNVVTGLVTYAIRDTDIGGLQIKKDDYIGILDGKIVTSRRRRIDSVKELIDQANVDDKEIITIIHGEGVPTREVNDLVRYIEKHYSHLEVDVIEGNQEVYSYILAIE